MATTTKTTASAKTATKKPAAKAATKPAVKKTTKAAAPAKKTKASVLKVSPHERYKMTEVAAYFIAEKHGFTGSPVDYWLLAEKQVSTMLA